MDEQECPLSDGDATAGPRSQLAGADTEPPAGGTRNVWNLHRLEFGLWPAL